MNKAFKYISSFDFTVALPGLYKLNTEGDVFSEVEAYSGDIFTSVEKEEGKFELIHMNSGGTILTKIDCEKIVIPAFIMPK